MQHNVYIYIYTYIHIYQKFIYKIYVLDIKQYYQPHAKYIYRKYENVKLKIYRNRQYSIKFAMNKNKITCVNLKYFFITQQFEIIFF